jgi:hypothetical protein
VNADTAVVTPAPSRTERMLSAPPLPLILRMASPNAIAFLVQSSAAGMVLYGAITAGSIRLGAWRRLQPRIAH